MTPLVGLHFLLAALLALILRSSILAAMIGTALGNPWTLPFFWAGTYEVGLWITGGSHQNGESVKFVQVFTGMVRSLIHADATLFIEQVWPIWMPMMVGSIPIGILAGVVSYFLLLPPLRTFQERRRQFFGPK
jgi:hypothetical protein